jgi:hypothetical protein
MFPRKKDITALIITNNGTDEIYVKNVNIVNRVFTEDKTKVLGEGKYEITPQVGNSVKNIGIRIKHGVIQQPKPISSVAHVSIDGKDYQGNVIVVHVNKNDLQFLVVNGEKLEINGKEVTKEEAEKNGFKLDKLPSIAGVADKHADVQHTKPAYESLQIKKDNEYIDITKEEFKGMYPNVNLNNPTLITGVLNKPLDMKHTYTGKFFSGSVEDIIKAAAASAASQNTSVNSISQDPPTYKRKK